METHRFEADVRQILHLVTHSLYSDREIFVRELVSNASDALDRGRFNSVQRDDLRPVEGEPGISIQLDETKNTLTFSDDGMGLTAEEATKSLGTIAHSGTKAFAAALKEKGENADGLVGQFGVGFYSAFMVADRVEVQSLSALPDAEPIHWESDGGDDWRIEAGKRDKRGTDIVLHLRTDAKDFLDLDKLRGIVKKHSNYIPWPVTVGEERANAEQALWTKAPADVSDEDYDGLYKQLSHDWQSALTHIHFRAEAPLQYNAVLFIPKHKPWEFDQVDYKPKLQLFQKRVKVLDHADSLLPRYLRFVAGVVDSPDVELNVSREILQQTAVIQTIRKQLVGRILKRLKEMATKDPNDYLEFWNTFGHVLKEGIVEDGDNKAKIIELLRFGTTKTKDDEVRSLREIKDGMQAGQEDIWYLTGITGDRLKTSPHLESFRKRDWEVILLGQAVDEWVVMQIREYEDVALKSAAHGEAPDQKEEDDPIADAAKEQAAPLVDWMKTLLAEDVAEVRISNRLTESPSVLVNQEGSMGSNMEDILAASNQDVTKAKRVLEINPEHPMVKTLARLRSDDKGELEPFARLLLDHAFITEGRLEDPQGFAKRLQTLMERASANL